MGKLKARVNTQKCQAFGACLKTAPGMFRLNAANKAEVVKTEAASDESTLAAAQNCPYRAITLVDAESGVQLYPPVRK
jgi:ferredoxin